MGFFLKGLALIAFGIVLQHVIRVIIVMGFHKHVYDHSPGPCHIVGNIFNGSEDMQTLPSGLVIISSGYKYPSNAYKAKHPGALYTFDFNNPDAGATKLSTDIELDNPHGISIWEDTETGKVVIFLVNHAKSEERIEKFEFDQNSKTLKHIKSITSPIFYSLNDVVATGPDTFYTTNYLRTKNPLTQTLEVFLLIHAGSVVYHDGKQEHFVITGLIGPNGINRSPDGRFLYVAAPIDQSIFIYEKKSDTSFKLKQKYKLDSLPDNIDVKKDNTLWIGGHALGHQISQYLEDPSVKSTSQVLRLKMDKDGHVIHTEEVYLGTLISGSTIAVYHEGAMLVGSVLTETIYCKVLHLE